MSYQAIARKYRPETFDEVVGQTHVTGTLRAAQRKDKLSHAYLFSGPRGCGKTTVARLLAKAINCLANKGGDPCGTCETCVAIAKGNYLDVLEIDAASNTGVDNIRELREMAQYSPSEGSSRVFIIDEVHMLSKGAFNALLKILEEPPARVFFFFATTEPNKIPRTILSRCQRFDFRLMSREELSGHLKKVAKAEGFEVDDTGLALLVSLAEGSVRDGLSLLDQVIASCDGIIDEATVVGAFGLVRSELFLELNESVITKDAARALRLVEDLSRTGQSLDAFASGVVTNFRNLMLLKVDPELAPMVDLSPDQVQKLLVQAANFSEQDLLALMDRAGHHFERIHRSSQPRIILEASVVEYCRFESRVLLSELARRLEGMSGTPTSGGGGSSYQAPSSNAAPPRPSGGGYKSSPAQASGPSRNAAPHPPRPASPPRPSSPAAAAGSTVQGWTQLIDVLMRKTPRVASCLMEGLPSLDLDQGKLTVAFAEEKKFQVTSIEKECSAIEDAAQHQYGRPMKVELVLGKSGQKADVKEGIRQEVAPTHREELDKACEGDADLNKLVETMGGQPLPETEREKWDKPNK